MMDIRRFSTALLLSLSVLALLPADIEAQWVRTQGTERQIIKAFAANGSTLFAGALGGPYAPWDTLYVGGAFRSIDNGASWVQINNGLTSGTVFPLSVYSLAIKGSKLFAGTSNGIFVSTNDGDSWIQLDFSPNNGDVRCLLVVDSTIFAGTDAGELGSLRDSLGGVFRSTDDGITWTPINTGLRNNGADKRVYALARIGSTLFAGTWLSGIFTSTDYGNSWSHNDTSNAGGIVTSLAVIDSTLFAGTWYGAVFRSTDMAVSWTRVDSGLTNPVNHYDYSIDALAVSGGNVFAGTVFDGVFLSTNYGASWTPVNGGLMINDPDNDDISSLAVIRDYLFAGTLTGGIARRPISEMITSVKESPPLLPDEYALLQNYPNPFNSSTMISYQLTVNSFVALEVYDALGRKVKTVVSGYKNAGTHSVTFDASQLPSGIYFAHLEANGHTMVRKMTLIK
jgi:hypothetical protein